MNSYFAYSYVLTYLLILVPPTRFSFSGSSCVLVDWEIVASLYSYAIDVSSCYYYHQAGVLRHKYRDYMRK